MWIPPVHSPLSASDVAGASAAGGAAVAELEDVLRSEYGAERAVLTDSGTHALQIALAAVAAELPRERRTVALPAYACYDLLTAARGAGVEVALYDIDPDTLGPEPASFARVLGEEGAGIGVVAYLYGVPLDWAGLRAAADAADCVLIEDAAQGVGTRVGGRPAGSLGELAVLSFGRGKGWTGGGGGALLLRGRWGELALPTLPPTAERRSVLVAKAVAQWAFGRPALYGLPARVPALGLGETVYHPPTPPRAIHPFQAALAARTRLASLSAAEARAARGRELARRIDELSRVRAPRLVGRDGDAWGALRLPVVVEGLVAPEETHLRPAGVYRGYPRALHRLESGPGPDERYAGAERLASSLLTLPTHAMAPPDRVARAFCTTLSHDARPDEIRSFQHPGKK